MGESGAVIWTLSSGSISIIEAGRFPTWRDSQTITMVDREENLNTVDVRTGEITATYAFQGIQFAQWSPDSKLAAQFRLADTDIPEVLYLPQLDIWDTETGAIQKIEFPNGYPSNSFAWLPDGSGLVGYVNDDSIWRWELGDEKAKIIVQARVDTSYSIAINKTGNFLASKNRDKNELDIFDSISGTHLLTLPDVRNPASHTWAGDDVLIVNDAGLLRANRISHLLRANRISHLLRANRISHLLRANRISHLLRANRISH